MEDINKKGFNFTVLFITLFTIVAIIALIIIWWPKSETKAGKISRYTSVTDGVQKSLNIYLSELKGLLTIDNIDKLYDKVDNKFLMEHKLTKENFSSYMIDNLLVSKNPIIQGTTTTKQDNGVYVYRVEYLTYGGLKKYVNIIEEKPYEYTLSFEQSTIPISGNKSYSKTSDDVHYTVSVEEMKSDGITYKLSIKNNGDKTVKYNFDNIDNVCIVLKDNNVIKLGAAVVSADDSILTKNGTITKSLYFKIGSDYYSEIKALVLKNVEVDGENKEVKIDFNK